MNYQYIEYQFVVADEHREILLAFLPGLHFDGIDESQKNTILAYVDKQYVDDEFESQLRSNIPVPFEMSGNKLEERNWNETWESNFTSVLIDDFCQVRASFHEPNKDVEHDLIIDPKMAFGTGHHETTSMMIRLMKSMDFYQKKVLDYGCGTAVLAILARRMGATSILAFDYDQNAVENSIENIKANAVPDITIDHGELADCQESNFDIILANINRTVLLESADMLSAMLNQRGLLLISGILIDDIDLVKSQYLDSGFQFLEQMTDGEWTAMKWTLN